MIDPQTQQAIDALRKEFEAKLETFRQARDVVFTESLKRRVFEDIIHAGVQDTDTTDINTTTSIGAGGGDVTAATPYDTRLRVQIDGTDYYIGLYEV